MNGSNTVQSPWVKELTGRYASDNLLGDGSKEASGDRQREEYSGKEKIEKYQN